MNPFESAQGLDPNVAILIGVGMVLIFAYCSLKLMWTRARVRE